MQEICSNTYFMLNPDSALPIKESAISLSTADNDTDYNPTNIKTPINVAFHHDDFMYKHKKFHLVLDVFKLGDSDDENVCDLNANECRKDGLKSKYIENVRVQKGEWKLIHLLMVAPSSLSSRGTSPCGCPRRLAT